MVRELHDADGTDRDRQWPTSRIVRKSVLGAIAATVAKRVTSIVVRTCDNWTV